jgi:lambda repressor-like predicted transcriptional regulator
MIDTQAIVDAYLNDKTQTSKTLAATYGLKPADIAAILRMSGITLRRGAPGGLSEDARAKARETQHTKSLARAIAKLVTKHGQAAVQNALLDFEEDPGAHVGN